MVAATPETSDTMGARVLVVFGSQTKTCERISKKMGEHFKSAGAVQSVEVVDGNSLAHELEDLESLKKSYDVMVICTSSFGDGDPPDNYGAFLLKIMTAAEEGNKPLAGMQHAVLGEGSSVYQETFQNCPRLSDKYLEACGSRRFLARHETDVGGEEDESVSRNAFRDGVVEALKKGLPAASAAPAAAFGKPRASHSEPTDQIKTKSAEELGGGRSQTWAQILVPATVAVVAISSYVYTQYVME